MIGNSSTPIAVEGAVKGLAAQLRRLSLSHWNLSKSATGRVIEDARGIRLQPLFRRGANVLIHPYRNKFIRNCPEKYKIYPMG